jgi:hypothetical protein
LSYVIWVLRLVEESLAVVTVPDEHVSEGVFAGQAVAGHVVSIDEQPCVNWVATVVNEALDVVVRAPQPYIIDNDVSGIHGDHFISLNIPSRVSTANSREYVVDSAGISCVASVALITPLEEGIGRAKPSFEEDSTNSNTVNVCNFDCRGAVGRDQSSETYAEDNSVSVIYLDSFFQVINTRLQHKVEAFI